MPAFLADYPPHRVAAITGLPEADIRAAARMIAEAGEWMSCWTMGLNQSTHGTWNTNAICNLHLATGRDLPARQRADVADRPAQRDGWPRNGLHGAGFARPAVGDLGAGPRVRREAVGPAAGNHPHRCRTRHHRDVRAARPRRHQGVLDHLHESRCHRGQPEHRDRRAARRPSSSSPRTPTGPPRPTATPTSCCPPRLWAESDAVMVNSERTLTLLQSVASRPPGRRARTGS